MAFDETRYISKHVLVDKIIVGVDEVDQVAGGMQETFVHRRINPVIRLRDENGDVVVVFLNNGQSLVRRSAVYQDVLYWTVTLLYDTANTFLDRLCRVA